MMVLVETFFGVESGNTVLKHMRACRGTALLASSHLEAVGITISETILQAPAVVDDDRENRIIEVPSVIGVMPGTASMKLIARTGIQLDSESVGITAFGPRVVIVVCITIHYDIESSIFKLGVTSVVSLGILTKSLLQTRVLIAIEAAEFHYAITTLEFHTVVSRVADVETTIMPVVGTYLVHDTSVVSSLGLCTTWLSREVEYWALCVTRIGKHTDTLVCSTCLSHIDGL